MKRGNSSLQALATAPPDMLKGQPANTDEARALDTYFTTVCENGLGNSSFAARVTVSTKASLASAIVSAYSAFTGPLHGGAPGPVLDMLVALVSFQVRRT